MNNLNNIEQAFLNNAKVKTQINTAKIDGLNAEIDELSKASFEASKNEIQKGGVVLDPVIHIRICQDFREWFSSKCKMKVKGIIPSPIKGPKGNIEFLIYAKKQL